MVMGLVEDKGFFEIVEGLIVPFHVKSVESHGLEVGERPVDREGHFELVFHFEVACEDFHDGDSAQGISLELVGSGLNKGFYLGNALDGDLDFLLMTLHQ
jgi:hypothetical protein